MGHSPWKRKLFFGIWGTVILALLGITVFCFVSALRPSDTQTSTTVTTEETVRSAEAVTTETKSTETKSTEAKSTEAKSTEAKSTEAKSTEAKSTEAKSTEAKSTEAKSTEAKSTEAKSTETASTEAKSTEAKSTEAKTTEAVVQASEGNGPSFLPGVFEFPANGGNSGEGKWLIRQGKSYHLGEDGKPLTDQIISWRANEYYLDTEGVLAVSQNRIIDDRLYEISKEGILALQQGWVEINGNRYYGKSDGQVEKDSKIADSGSEYYLDPDGVLVKDCNLRIGDRLYKADADGKLSAATGWVELDGALYYGDAGGLLAKERQVRKDGNVCYVGTDGKIVTSDFYNYNGDLFFADENGNVRRSEGWFRWNKRWYYSDADGRFVHDEYITVDKEKYYLDSTGARIVGKPTIDMYLKCPNIFDWMISHHTDYYFKTNYTSLRYHSTHPEELIRPYGEYGEDSAMNCTGFISSLVYYSGGDLERVSAMGRYGGYGNGDNYLSLATKGYVRYEVFRSAKDLLKSGKAHKGDIMYLAPVWRSGADCHMGVFWGDTSSENALWSQTMRTKCTVTEIYMVDPVNQIYYFPISRNSVIEYYEGDTP